MMKLRIVSPQHIVDINRILGSAKNCRYSPTQRNSSPIFNPLCGDRIRIELKLLNTVVKEVRFRGDGCAISIAAASLLTELILSTDPNTISDEQLVAALESDIKPARIQCALLPLEALRAGLKT